MDIPDASCVIFADVEAAAERLRGIVHETPIAVSSTLDAVAGCEVRCKAENLQRMGAFKIRGAYNTLSRLPADAKGVVSGSSGNHAQGVALAARLLGLKAVIVMPDDVLKVKLEATLGYGAEVVLFDRMAEDRDDAVARVSAERGFPVIPSYNHPHVIAGQGTVALEFHRQAAGLDAMLMPVSGGGLMTGCAVASKALRPECRIYGVEPEGAEDFFLSLRDGRIRRIDHSQTVADALRVPQPGSYTYPLAKKWVDGILVVKDAWILEATEFVWNRMKLVVEPSGAVGVAALMHKLVPGQRGRRIGVVLSGGNADIPATAAAFGKKA